MGQAAFSSSLPSAPAEGPSLLRGLLEDAASGLEPLTLIQHQSRRLRAALRADAVGVCAELRRNRISVLCIPFTYPPVSGSPAVTLFTRHADVKAILGRPCDFGVKHYARLMRAVLGNFPLGRDTNSQEYQQETLLLQKAAQTSASSLPSDIASYAASLVARHCTSNRLDFVADLVAPLALEAVVINWLGVGKGLPRQQVHTCLRDLFSFIFVNQEAFSDVAGLKSSADSLVQSVVAAIAAYQTNSGADTMGQPRPDFLASLVDHGTGFSRDELARLLVGTAVGVADTTVSAAANVLDYLLDHPEATALAVRAAQAPPSHIANEDPLWPILREALRFRPQATALARTVTTDTLFETADGTIVPLKAGTLEAPAIVLACITGAMSDPAAFPHPEEFDPNRSPNQYLHFGGSTHTCIGQFIAPLVLCAAFRQILVLPHLRRALGHAGFLDFHNPKFFGTTLPQSLTVVFDSGSAPSAPVTAKATGDYAVPPGHLVDGAMTVVAPILPGYEASLEELLERIGTDIPARAGNNLIRFAEFPAIHFARWTILGPAQEATSNRSLLVFGTDHDGSDNDLLEALVRDAGSCFQQVYSHCEAWPGGSSPFGQLPSSADAVAYLRNHRIPYHARHVAFRGVSAAQIRRAVSHYRRLQNYLDQEVHPAFSTQAGLGQPQNLSKALVTKLASVIDTDNDPAPSHQPPKTDWPLAATFAGSVLAWAAAVGFTPSGWRRALIASFPFAAAGAFVLALRLKERKDEQEYWRRNETLSPGSERLTALRQDEDVLVQNQMTHIVPLKPGSFRRFLLRTVLTAVDYRARHAPVWGKLGDIATIHRARWMILNDSRLLFFSNYDGSWESYLGDFVDRASLGLTGIWSNTKDFPPTRFLLWNGARSVVEFKRWTRAHQIVTQVWYSAYPDVSVRNIQDALEVVAAAPVATDIEAKKWLMRL